MNCLSLHLNSDGKTDGKQMKTEAQPQIELNPNHPNHPKVMHFDYVLTIMILFLLPRIVTIIELKQYVSVSSWMKWFLASQDFGILLLIALIAYGLSLKFMKIFYYGLWVLIYYQFLLNAIISKIKSYPTINELKPEHWADISEIIQTYGNFKSVSMLIFLIVFAFFGPQFIARYLKPSIKQHLQKPIVFVLLTLYSFGTLIFTNMSISALNLQVAPIFAIAKSLIYPESQDLIPLHTQAQTPNQIAKNLQKIIPQRSASGLEVLRQRLEIEQGRNVILVVLESTSATALEALNLQNPLFLKSTPAIRFEEHHSTVPHSASALTSLFCGRPRLVSDRSQDLQKRCLPLGKYLNQKGIKTGFFQSTYFGDWIKRDFFENFGFSTLMDSLEMAKQLSDDQKQKMTSGKYMQEWGTLHFLKDWMNQKCQNQEHFFAVYYSWVAHAPYPQKHMHKDVPWRDDLSNHPQKNQYLNLLRSMDFLMQDLWTFTKALSCQRKALLVVIGDHGEAFEEHAGNLYHAAYTYEENLKTPLYIFDPELIKDIEVNAPTDHLDLHLTLAHLVTGSSSSYLATPFSRDLLESIEPKLQVGLSLMDGGMLSGRWGQWKVMKNHSQSALFDLEKDPLETHNLAQSRTDLLEHYLQAINAWYAFTKQYLTNPTDQKEPLP
jgi:membrane-anchored protein YejM (alkaline phosphatase superfamily)